MIRNFKMLGLALVAAFAFSAMTASSALAVDAHFKADTSGAPAKFHVEDDGSGSTATQFFTTSFGSVDCDIFTGEGSDADGTASTLTVDNVSYTHSDGTCEITGLALDATIDFKSCDYTFHAGTWLGTTPATATGDADIDCETAGDKIQINAPGCQITVGAQADLGGHIIYHQVSPAGANNDYVTAEATVTGIDYEGHKLLCATGLKTNGTYTGNAIATATDNNGNSVDGTIVAKS